ncbi:MAG: hypothetical protein E3J82_05755 [Candidatus Thorarchaeota archaeon]|nr:MAG: hypothetical protein E3J82_05755 [Candidatus Thorarchaeota archaeon]
MKFNTWSKDRILHGMKRLTSRRIAYMGDPDVEYITPQLPWWFIKEFLYRGEGAFSPDELQRVINQIFRRKVGPEELFYVHVLKESEG